MPQIKLIITDDMPERKLNATVSMSASIKKTRYELELPIIDSPET